jgi:hypothetical protein
MTGAAGRIVAVGVLLAACGASSEPAAAPPPGGPPRLEFSVNPIDLGPRFDDERPQTSIGLRNAGGRTLHVERVDANCGCIGLGDAPKSIEPGKVVDLKFEIRLAGMTGKVSRHVVVRSDDPASPLSRVMIEAEVRPRLETSKTLIELRPATIDAGASADFEVHGATGEDLAPLSWSSTTTDVKVSAAVSGKTARVLVTAAPFTEDFTGAVVLRLDKSERIVPVKGVSARDVRADPPRVWAEGKVGAKIGQTKLVGREGVNWRVRGLESDKKELTAEVVDGVLRVRILAGAPAGEFKGVVTVLLEGAKPDRLRVEVTAWIESP